MSWRNRKSRIPRHAGRLTGDCVKLPVDFLTSRLSFHVLAAVELINQQWVRRLLFLLGGRLSEPSLQQIPALRLGGGSFPQLWEHLEFLQLNLGLQSRCRYRVPGNLKRGCVQQSNRRLRRVRCIVSQTLSVMFETLDQSRS